MSEMQNRCFYSEGDIIIEEGQPGSHICIIEKGKVEVWRTNSAQQKVILGYLASGQIFGEMSIIEKSPRTASITALEPTTIININGDKLLEALNQCPPIIATLLRTLVQNLARSQSK